jgi:hypothetical protein
MDTTLTLRELSEAIREAETRHSDLMLRMFSSPTGDCSGSITREPFLEEPSSDDPDIFIFHSLEELTFWARATPIERVALELYERHNRRKRETEDFAKIDLLLADAGRPQ